MEMAGGRHGPIHWTCLLGPGTAETWDTYVDHLLRDVAPTLTPGDVVFDLWHDVGPPPPRIRDRFARQFLITPEVRHVRAHAVVTNSTLTRGALTAINWVIKRPFEERLFSSPGAALVWLKALVPDLDVDALRAEIEAAVPGCATLDW